MMANKVWRVITGGAETGYSNMAIDEAIMRSVSRRESPPTLRFYAWNPPAVSIGYFQKMPGEVDPGRCSMRGFDLVRRPTGGRAVLHDDEVTYSVCITESDLPGTVVETYKILSTGLVRGLNLLGIEASLVPHGSAREERSSAACFDAPSWYEVVCDGKKVIGSAQVRRMGAILQHGSVPITFSAENMAYVLAVASERVRARIKSTLQKKAAGLSDFLPSRPSFVEVSTALTDGLRQTLHIELHEMPLLDSEKQEAARLMDAKYARLEWNTKR